MRSVIAVVCVLWLSAAACAADGVIVRVEKLKGPAGAAPATQPTIPENAETVWSIAVLAQPGQPFMAKSVSADRTIEIEGDLGAPLRAGAYRVTLAHDDASPGASQKISTVSELRLGQRRALAGLSDGIVLVLTLDQPKP